MIPKIIHYCWFGGNPLPDMAVRCIQSWKKYCPDYEIIEWNENNFDVRCCDYIREAYEAKKWAFVSDYARFKIIYEYGGLYFDTDVELIKSPDELVAVGGFMGREPGTKLAVAPGMVLCAAPHSELIGELLTEYHSRHFIRSDGSLNLTTIVEYTTALLKKYGLKAVDGIQQVRDFTIYPSEYFSPMNNDTGKIVLSPNTYSIHHYMASWHSPSEQYATALKRKLIRFLPRKAAAILATSVAKIRCDGLAAFIKWAVKRR